MPVLLRCLIILLTTVIVMYLCVSDSLDKSEEEFLKQSFVIRHVTDKLLHHYHQSNQDYDFILTKNLPNIESLSSKSHNLDTITNFTVVRNDQFNAQSYSKILIVGEKKPSSESPGQFCTEFLAQSSRNFGSVRLSLFTVAAFSPGSRRGTRYSVRWRGSVNGTALPLQLTVPRRRGPYNLHELDLTNVWPHQGHPRAVSVCVRMRPIITVTEALLVMRLSESQPQLLRIGGGNRMRTLRHLRAPICTDKSLSCCLSPFEVSPIDIGLVNIPPSQRIKLNYCRGECNNFSPLKTHHAKLLALYSRQHSTRLSALQLSRMRSCCGPSHYSSVVIEHTDSSTETLPNIVVTDCGCL